MKIDVRECNHCGGYHLDFGEVTILTSNEKGVCQRNARILSKARDLPFRSVVKLLMEEIGYGEDTAQAMYAMMQGHSSSSQVQ